MAAELEDINTLLAKGREDSRRQGTAQTPPKAPRQPRRKKAISKKDLRATITAGLSTANFTFYMLANDSYRPDALNEQEIALLTDAVIAEVEAYPALESLIASSSFMAPHLKLGYALLIIMYPRLVRHHLIPDITGASQNGAANGQHTDANTVETGGASGPYWGHWNGQNYAGSRIVDNETARNNDQNQSG